MKKIKVILIGISGKMGQAIQQCSNDFHEIQILGGFNHLEFVSYDKDLSQEQCLLITDVIIDFSSPYSLPTYLPLAEKLQIPIVIGTTNYTSNQIEIIKKASKALPIFYASNFSIGIAILKKLTKIICHDFENAHILLKEAHHRHKKDAPSGTAKDLISIINKDHQQLDISTLRAGSIIGEHSLRFVTDEEELYIAHKAHSRNVFAKGAIKAALFIYKQQNGLYSMEDLLKETI
ncbi:MAG TPA: dihydrodipicolinate reductase C-terminal domain-containing protein [Chlamydiales bacterium]|nr:dihydrodipicolinate reductase C-terminal domain-containing protein [Chlamydiales bacterium]